MSGNSPQYSPGFAEKIVIIIKVPPIIIRIINAQQLFSVEAKLFPKLAFARC